VALAGLGAPYTAARMRLRAGGHQHQHRRHHPDDRRRDLDPEPRPDRGLRWNPPSCSRPSGSSRRSS
jgi:hypothetical protein